MAKIKYVFSPRYQEYNFTPFLIFSIGNQIVVIDNDDPRIVDTQLYEACTFYFCSNKLIAKTSYQQIKVRPLYPHYPINIIPLYLRLFNLKTLISSRFTKELYILSRRPRYKNKKVRHTYDNYVFFSCSNWKNEQEANAIRAAFIETCKSHPAIKFEGGFTSRKNNNLNGIDTSLIVNKYHPKKFSKLIRQSMIGFNNPAVKGAMSWRLAEYLNNGTFILSYPFKIELPTALVHKEHIYYIKNTSCIKAVLNAVIDNRSHARQVGTNAKDYFERYCTPEAQANYILKTLSTAGI